MIVRLLLIICFIINISLIIALVWKVQNTLDIVFKALNGSSVSYMDASNLIFLGKELNFPATQPGTEQATTVGYIKDFTTGNDRIVVGIRGLVWFVVIQAIIDFILAFAWPTAPQPLYYRGAGGRRR